jgi:hypothetical protein
MADGVAARTDGENIWVDDRLNDIELRCAIEHEMTHIRRQEGTCQPEYVEMEVRYETAERLLPQSKLGNCRGTTLREVADGLGVTRRVLMDRAAMLTQDQATAAGCDTCQLCPVQKARTRQTVRTRPYPMFAGFAVAC